MRVPIGDGAVPFVITYRRIIKKPKIIRRRRFNGVFGTIRNLLVKFVEVIEEAALTEETECVDPGRTVTVHWALTIDDPFDTTPGTEKTLVAYRMMGDAPPSGLHFEVFIPESEGRQKDSSPPATGGINSTTSLLHDITPEDFELLRRRQQSQRDSVKQGLVEQRPVAQEYVGRVSDLYDEPDTDVGEKTN